MGRWRWRPSLAGAFVLLLVSVLAYGPPHAAAESMADLAVWQIVNKKRTYTGTAFAIGERHFLTNAHVIEGFVDHDSKQIVLRQQGNALELTVNYHRVALSLTYDLALFTTREAVEHVLELAGRETAIRESQHRIVGYLGRGLEGLAGCSVTLAVRPFRSSLAERAIGPQDGPRSGGKEAGRGGVRVWQVCLHGGTPTSGLSDGRRKHVYWPQC